MASKGQAQSRSESHSDGNAVMKQALATHSPDGREFSVKQLKPLLHIVEYVLNQGAHHAQQMGQDASNEMTPQNGFHEMLDLLSLTINKIACEMSCKCSGGGNEYDTTLAIFNIVSSFSWDIKVVLALAAFAVNYGEFWLVRNLRLENRPLAKAVTLLKQFPDILERPEIFHTTFVALNNLIKEMVKVTKCIVELKEVTSQYITYDMSVTLALTSLISTAVYWTIRSIAACASEIMDHKASITDPQFLTHTLGNIYNDLLRLLNRCRQFKEEEKLIEEYGNLVRLFESVQIDNMNIFRALIKDDQPPLFHCSNKTKALDVLSGKNVLLFISDLDIPQPMYRESLHSLTKAESRYEVVWIPVVDPWTLWDETKLKKFEDLRLEMPCYSICSLSWVKMVAIKYIKEVWHFKKQPLLVVLDPQGKVVNSNAINMMWIWGKDAFPFTSIKEEALWKEETLRIELLLARTIEPKIMSWIKDGKCIYLYGGEDIEWIRKFNTAAKKVKKEANIQLEMLYVGKTKYRVQDINTIITEENLSHVLPSIWFFWERLQSLWHSRVQQKWTMENDQIARDVMRIFSMDGSGQGWAVVSEGSSAIVRAKGDTILSSFLAFESWKQQAEEKGFVPALKNKLQGFHTLPHCNHRMLPWTTGSIPEGKVCAKCGSTMEKFILYLCWTD